MFTGIVAELGEVAGIEHRGDAARLTIRGSVEGVFPGESIAVNGVCLTVTGIMDGTFTADVMGETLSRSGLGVLAPGAPVNLERSVRLADRLGGHLVQGHVDATGTVISRSPAAHWDQVRISLPPAIARYVVHKGSIAVDGVSLTVSALGPPGAAPDGDPWFEVCLIPETLKRTTLGGRQPGEIVNLEVDVIAKYVERLLIAPQAGQAGQAGQEGLGGTVPPQGRGGQGGPEGTVPPQGRGGQGGPEGTVPPQDRGGQGGPEGTVPPQDRGGPGESSPRGDREAQ